MSVLWNATPCPQEVTHTNITGPHCTPAAGGLGVARNHLVSFPGGAAGLGTTPENHRPLSSTAKDLGAEQGAPRSVDTAYERD